MWGFLQRCLHAEMQVISSNKGVKLVQPMGLAVLLFVHGGVAWFPWITGLQTRPAHWNGVLVTLGVLGCGYFLPKIDLPCPAFISFGERFSLFRLGHRWFWRIYWLVRNGVAFLTTILEGAAGVLWTVLLLILLLSMLSQIPLSASQ